MIGLKRHVVKGTQRQSRSGVWTFWKVALGRFGVRRQSAATTALLAPSRRRHSAGGFRRLRLSKAVSRSACHRTPKGDSTQPDSFDARNQASSAKCVFVVPLPEAARTERRVALQHAAKSPILRAIERRGIPAKLRFRGQASKRARAITI